MEQKDLFTHYDIKHIIAMVLAVQRGGQEVVHLAFKIRQAKNERQNHESFQFLIFFHLNEDPSVFFSEGGYLEENKNFHCLSHRDPNWEKTIEAQYSHLVGNAIETMLTRIGKTTTIVHHSNAKNFVFRKGNLFPLEEGSY